MFTRLNEIDRRFAEMDALAASLLGPGLSGQHGLKTLRWAGWPGADIHETETGWELKVDVPGLSADEVELTVTANTLALKAERDVSAPEGYRPLVRERKSFRIAREFRLPVEADAEQVTAKVADGVLTVTLPKRPEVAPRRITVKEV